MNLDRFFFSNQNSYLNAADWVAWKKQQQMYNFQNLPSTAIITPANVFTSFVKIFKRKIKGTVYPGIYINNIALFEKVGIGAPAVVNLMEEIRLLGVKNIIFVGFAGILNNQIEEGEICLASKAVSLSSVSGYYTSEKTIQWENLLFFRLRENFRWKEGCIASVDVPFRETDEMIKHFRELSCDLIDMETSGVLSAGKFYRLNTASVLISADRLFPAWKPPENIELLQKKLRQTIIKLSKIFD